MNHPIKSNLQLRGKMEITKESQKIVDSTNIYNPIKLARWQAIFYAELLLP